MTSLSLSPCWVSSPRHDLPSIERALCPMRQLLVIVKICMHSALLCPAGCYYGSQVFQVASIAGCYLPLRTCILSSGTIKASPLGGDFQVRASSGSPALMSEVHGIFSNRDLPSIPRKQPGVTAIAHIVQITQINNPKGDFSCLMRWPLALGRSNISQIGIVTISSFFHSSFFHSSFAFPPSCKL